MELTRRALLWNAAAAGLVAAPLRARSLSRIEIGVMDNVLGLTSKPEAVAAAAKLGFAGLQVTAGKPDAAGNLALMDPGLQSRFLEKSKKHNVALASTYLDVLHKDCLKNAAVAKKWVRQGIEITSKLRAKILMLVFFGNCALLDRAEMDMAASALKELAPEARDAGIILGFENLLKAEDNAYVLDKVNSQALRVYCDVGNLTNLVGVDAPGQIRKLGKRICQFHFKDQGYLGEGKVNCPEALRAIRDIGFEGWVVLETNWPSRNMEADTKRNLNYIRSTIQELERGSHV
jgi:L-ribulose-5-phosphate 3-epimerase